MSNNNEGRGLSAIKNDPRTEEEQRADYHRYMAALKEPRPAPPNTTSLLTERLIQAAVDYETGRCSRRELSEARAAVETAIHGAVGQQPSCGAGGK